MATDVRDIIKQLAFVRGLAAADLDRLAAGARFAEWPAGATVFREGDQDDNLYIVVEGEVAIDVSVPYRGRVRILTVPPGEVFGWSSVFYRKPKTAAATTIAPTRAVVLDAAKLREAADAEPRFGYWLARRLLDVVSDRLKATRMQALDVFAQ